MTSLAYQWADAENIVIIGQIPYYRVTGNSYRDVYKNGLSLDELCLMLPCDISALNAMYSAPTPVEVPIAVEVVSPIANTGCPDYEYKQTAKRPKYKRNRKYIGIKKQTKKTCRVSGNDTKHNSVLYDSNITEFDILEQKLNKEKIAKTNEKRELEFELWLNAQNVYDEVYDDRYDDRWLDADMWE
jgi:hypothetical protein